MGKITKNYIYNLIYQLLVLVIPLVTAPYLVRVLGAEGTGEYGFVHSIATLLTTVTLLGIFNFGSREIAYVRDNKADLTKRYNCIMSARLVLGIVGTAVYGIVILILNRYQGLFLIYYSFILANFLDCTWLYVGVEEMKWPVLKNAFVKIVGVIGIFVFVKNPGDVWIYVTIQGGSLMLGNLLAYSQQKRYVGKFKFDFSMLKEDLIGSLLLFLPALAATIYLQCDKIMIELITNATEQVSYYDYSEKIITIPLSFITVLSTVMMPRIANEFKKGNKEEIGSLVNRSAKCSLWMALPLMGGIIVIAGKFIPWYLGDAFLPTVTAIMILAPIILTNTLSGISGTQYFTATNQVKILMKSQVIACIGNIVLNGILIPFIGFMGAAIATIVTSFICAGIQYSYMVKQIELPGILKAGIKYVVFSGIMAGSIWGITIKMPATPLTTLVQILIGMVVYLLLCLITKDPIFFEFVAKIKGMVKKH